MVKHKKILMLLAFICVTISPVFSGQTLEDYLVEKGYLSSSIDGIEKVNWGEVNSLTIEEINKKFPDRLGEIREVMLKQGQFVKTKILDNAEKAYNLYKLLKNDSELKLKSGYDEIKINEEMARCSLGAISNAYQAFYTHNHIFPQNLSELVNTIPSYLDKDFDDSRGNPKVFGYEFKFTAIGDNNFCASAFPVAIGKTGNKYFVVNQLGKVVEDLNNNGELDSDELLMFQR